MRKPGRICNILFLILFMSGIPAIAGQSWADTGGIIKSDKASSSVALPNTMSMSETNPARTVCISAVGDCTLGFDSNAKPWGRFDQEVIRQKNKYSYFFDRVAPILSQDDLTIANLETTLTTASVKEDKSNYKRSFHFKGNPAYANILTAGSVEAVNLANNHSHDYLSRGYQDTVRVLENSAIAHFGNGVPAFYDINGVKIGMLGYNATGSFGKGKNLERIRKKVTTDISALKKECPLVVVSFHWGNEYKYYADPTQRLLGHCAIDAGADLVLGHHSHVIGPIEIYRGKYIAYSLGNFCFGGNKNPSDKRTIIFQQTFTIDENNQVVNQAPKIIPCVISSETGRNNYQPVILERDPSSYYNTARSDLLVPRH
ncbi:MAG: CapA family protein [Chitinophagales bacterium]